MRPLLVVDGDSFAHRAYHALPKSMRREDGRPENALLGFTNMLLRLWQDERPRTVLVAWDSLDVRPTGTRLFPRTRAGVSSTTSCSSSSTCFRHSSGRAGLRRAKEPGYEADDFLAAAADGRRRPAGRRSWRRRTGTRSSSSTDRVTVLQPARGAPPNRIGPAEVRERYGVDPAQVPDFIALRGDPSDKIPGARGIGAKRAADLLAQYPSLDAMLDEGRFASEADALRLYLRIATMDRDAPLPELPDCEPDWEAAESLSRASTDSAGWRGASRRRLTWT